MENFLDPGKKNILLLLYIMKMAVYIFASFAAFSMLLACFQSARGLTLDMEKPKSACELVKWALSDEIHPLMPSNISELLFRKPNSSRKFERETFVFSGNLPLGVIFENSAESFYKEFEKLRSLNDVTENLFSVIERLNADKQSQLELPLLI